MRDGNNAGTTIFVHRRPAWRSGQTILKWLSRGEGQGSDMGRSIGLYCRYNRPIKRP